jgi:hypothetical protein
MWRAHQRAVPARSELGRRAKVLLRETRPQQCEQMTIQ